MLIFAIILLFLASYSAGGYTTRKLLKSARPEPPALDTPENILDYLEACSLTQDNEATLRLLDDFREFTNDKKLLSGKVEAKADKPAWHHSTTVVVPAEKHWEIAFNDLKREKDSKDKIEVIRHWMLGIGNRFTIKEMDLILNEFDNSEDRAEVRKIYALARAEYKNEKPETVRKTKPRGVKKISSGLGPR